MFHFQKLMSIQDIFKICDVFFGENI